MPKGLRSQILALTILPAAVITIILGIYFSTQRNHDLHNYTINRGKTSAEQFAINAQFALTSSNHSALQQLINNALEESGVRAAGIFSANKIELYHAGPAFQTKLIFDQTTTTQFKTNGNIYTFYAPIFLNQFTSQLNHQLDKNTSLGWIAIEYNTNDLLLTESRSVINQFLLLAFSFVATVVIILKVSNNFINDIQHLNEKIKGLQEGRLNKSENKSSSLEIKQLTNNIQQLFQHLKSEHSDIKLEYEQLYHDEQNAKERLEIQNIELNEAKKEAIAASKSKSEFLANTSHEVRTPLNGIIGFTKLLAKTPLNKQQTDFVETIAESSEDLLSIVNDILDFSKIEAGKLELDITPFNLRYLVEECISLFAPQAFEKNVEMILIFYQDVPERIHGDALRLKQVISNLLSNAAKFTPEGNIILRVSLESRKEEQATIGIAISDTGIGMTAQQQANIFNSFSQANTSISREYGGTGLGLAIVKKLVELMQDTIKLESDINKGSTFSFNLRTTIIPTPLEHSVINENHSILVIEPHKLLQQSLKNMLNQFYQRVFVAKQLADGLQQIQEHHIDLIVLGVDLNASIPNINEDLQRLTPLNLPIILMLNNNSREGIITPPNYSLIKLQKPITSNALKKTVMQLLDHSPIEIPNNIPMSIESNISILIVDDHPANTKLLYTLLSDKGISVTTANNGMEAIECCKTAKFNLIFMDIQMPILNGIDATIAIRKEYNLNNTTPIIAITAHAMADEKNAIMSVGMNDYLTKPLVDKQLDQMIQKYCGLNKNLTSKIVDINLCLQLANNKADLAYDMFSMLCNMLPNEMQNINNAATNSQDSTLLSLVHKLHGACCYTGVPNLKKAAHAFEQAIKEEEKLQYQALLLALNNAYKEIIDWNNSNNIAQEISKA